MSLALTQAATRDGWIRDGLRKAMRGNPRIHAISDVRIEAPPGREEVLRKLYRDLLGLCEAQPPPELAPALAFEAHGRRLNVRILREAMASPMRRRLLIEVDSLEQAAERLWRSGFSCELMLGMGIGDRRVVLLDPGGNRVELKEVRPL